MKDQASLLKEIGELQEWQDWATQEMEWWRKQSGRWSTALAMAIDSHDWGEVTRICRHINKVYINGGKNDSRNGIKYPIH